LRIEILSQGPTKFKKERKRLQKTWWMSTTFEMVTRPRAAGCRLM